MRRGTAKGATLALALMFIGSPSADAQERDDLGSLEDYRAELEALSGDGSWWRASNAAYAAGDEDPDGYGTRFWVEPGGVSSGGCLWSIRDGKPVGVHWRFYQGWHGARGRPFYYQAHTSGTITGMGHLTERDGRATVMEQEFESTNGTSQRIRHRTEWTDADTYVTKSAIWSEEGWKPLRTYTWTRQTSGAAPCGPQS